MIIKLQLEKKYRECFYITHMPIADTQYLQLQAYVDMPLYVQNIQAIPLYTQRRETQYTCVMDTIVLGAAFISVQSEHIIRGIIV